MRLVLIAVITLVMFLAAAYADETCCPSDGSHEGESIDARIERLETALRLAKAEKRVNTQTKKKVSK